MNDTSIFIVEDETIVAKNIEKRLLNAGYKITGSATTAEEAITKITSAKPDLVLMDIKLKGKMDGIEAADEIRKSLRLPVVFLTSYTDEETFQRAKITEPFGYLIKPFDIKELNRTVEIALYKNRINNELLENQRRYEIAVEAGKTGVWEYLPDENKIISDNSLKKILDLNSTEKEDSFDEWINKIYEDDREYMLGSIENYIKGKSPEFKTECRMYRKDGSVGWIESSGILSSSENGKPLRLIGTSTDITERKLSELALQKSEEEFRRIFENAGIGMIISNLGGQIIRVNTAFCEMLGYKEKNLLQMNVRDITHPADFEAMNKLVRELVNDTLKSAEQIEKRYVHKSGETIWSLTSVSLAKQSSGKPLYFIAQIQNITQRKKAEEQLKKYAEELKTLNISKDKFFSIISHDLRSPFNSLLGVTEYMSEYYNEMTTEEVKESILNIYRSAQKVYNLILNLLEWSRLQSGRLEMEKTKINMKDLCIEILELYKEPAGAKQIEIVNNISEDIFVNADKYMIDTVLRNLVSNAIKFTANEGKVELKGEAGGNVAKISIADNGVGIKKENQKKLFRIDEQFRRDGTAEEKGTGLGLILCKEFIEKNGGTITLESEEGKGSTFIFTLPLAG